jgi:hypothetical protein
MMANYFLIKNGIIKKNFKLNLQFHIIIKKLKPEMMCTKSKLELFKGIYNNYLLFKMPKVNF